MEFNVIQDEDKAYPTALQFDYHAIRVALSFGILSLY